MKKPLFALISAALAAAMLFSFGVSALTGDFTGDGKVTSDDAVYLLRHTLFPERFPLKEDVQTHDPTPDEFFEFNLLEDGTYEISAKDKDNLPSELVIPSTHDGITVTSIAEDAFSDCTGLTSVIIPDGVTNIDRSAFARCTGLTNVIILDSVTSIDGKVFCKCTGLNGITFNGTMFEWNGIVTGFMWNDMANKFVIHCTDSDLDCHGYLIYENVCVSFYDDYDGGATITAIIERLSPSFSGTDLIIPETILGYSVTSIGSTAFEDCSFTSMSIPESVTLIDWCAFEGCTALETVYYAGTEDQWDCIFRMNGNDALFDATVIFNYEP